jgi:hypothetical protein
MDKMVWGLNMSEGELKKRSKQNRQITELFFLGDVDIETKNWVSTDDVDEAKKEFPMFPKAETVEDAKKIDDMYYYYRKQVWDWKKKWFGT